MSDSEARRGVRAAGGVLGLAALAIAAGLLTPHDPVRHASVASLRSAEEAVAAEALAAGQTRVEPQPEVVLRHTPLTLSGPLERPEVAALLNRLGGADPSIRGLAPVDPLLDAASLQRALQGAPGVQVRSDMTVIARGGQATAIGVDTTTTDPLTGVVTGREQVTILATATVLGDGRVVLSASLRTEADSSALAVLGRRLGVVLGRTGEVEDGLVLAAGQAAVIRLPGTELQAVVITIEVRPASPVEAGAPATTPEHGTSEQVPSPPGD